mmetsp:Transcript_133141/g.385162  ORF Transcript_133141/g.385162 Transcript_133141/m.385162 type:complete len:96 (-) Transcript_133141:195-482(-)
MSSDGNRSRTGLIFFFFQWSCQAQHSSRKICSQLVTIHRTAETDSVGKASTSALLGLIFGIGTLSKLSLSTPLNDTAGRLWIENMHFNIFRRNAG